MQDLIGTTLGHYRIVEQIGAGGMGVVYRARDERLDRDVAIKVLPQEVAADPERLARFEREAKLLASLNHPNIATLHGLEEEKTQRFLVMELVEGESLAGVIARGAVPVDEALPIALQIAQALEAAHENGIIHRDLKPANVMVDAEGGVKVLDFGLAKAFDPDSSSPQSPESIAESPTLTAGMTRAGTLLGTAAYMSPEQARGKAVDKRADIWAFGCVLFEMLTGSRPFHGTSSTDVLAAVIKEDVDWGLLPATVSAPLHRLLSRCLTKDPRDRLHAIADARIELQSLKNVDSLTDEVAAPSASGEHRWLLLGVAAAFGLAVGVLVASVAFWKERPNVKPPAVTRLEYVLPDDQKISSSISRALCLSPDGSRLVYSASGRLFIRQMDRSDPIPIRGTENYDFVPRGPIFSPDGEQVGFWTSGKLRKVQVNGGTPTAICETEYPLGVYWGVDDVILFGRGPRGIWRVSANGGDPTQVISVDPDKGEFAHGPQMLPDGKHVLFTIKTGLRLDNSQIFVQSLETGKRRLLIDDGTDARYVPTGHIVFLQDGTLFAVTYNVEKQEVSARRIPVVQNVRQTGTGTHGAGQLSISETGTLAYEKRVAEPDPSRLVWVDRSGEVQPIMDHEETLGYLGLSPDGERVAVTISRGVLREIWVFDLLGNRPPFPIRRGGCSWDPVWTPDGERIIFAYADSSNTTEDLYWISADGNDVEPKLLHTQRGQQYPHSISSDGQDLFFIDYGIGETRDVWVFDMTKASDPRPLLDSDFVELHATTSPNKRWIAFTSDRTGREEIWVASYPDLQQRQRVSFAGGREPRWSHDGRELYYRAGNEMMVAAVTIDELNFGFETPRKLFDGEFWGYPSWPTYGVAPDGRFLMIQGQGFDQSTSEREPQRIQIVLNWFEELKRLVPTD